MSNPVFTSIQAGLDDARRRPTLVLLVYAVNLVGALLLSVPLYGLLVDSIGRSGFGDQKLLDFDILLWQEALVQIGPSLGVVALQLLWLIPLYMAWRVVAGVGLVYALQQGGTWPFWRGVARYVPRGILLALLWLLVRVLIGSAVIVAAITLMAAWGGEVGAFWTIFVILPTLLISGMAMVDLFERYGRLALIIRHEYTLSAFATGAVWPFRHGNASALYLFWFFFALAILAVPTLIGSQGASSTAGVWIAFLLQQLVLLVRAAITVAWTGSEVALFERVWMSAPALIPGSAT
jgi:MFS family permease